MTDDIDWHEYFKEYKRKWHLDNDNVVDPDLSDEEIAELGYKPLVFLSGVEIDPIQAPTPVRSLVAHCESKGMVAKVGHSISVKPANRKGKGKNEEMVCKGAYCEAYYVEAVYPKQLRVRATWEWNGTSRTKKGAPTYSVKGVQMKTFARGQDGKHVMQVIDLTVTEFKKLTGG